MLISLPPLDLHPVVILAFFALSPLALTSFGRAIQTPNVPPVLLQFSPPPPFLRLLEIWLRLGQPPTTSDQTSFFQTPLMAKTIWNLRGGSSQSCSNTPTVVQESCTRLTKSPIHTAMGVTTWGMVLTHTTSRAITRTSPRADL